VCAGEGPSQDRLSFKPSRLASPKNSIEFIVLPS
jgi:hypothetical protein